MTATRITQILILVASALGALPGCANREVLQPSGSAVRELRPDESGRVAGTGIESQDIITVTERMAQRILETPEIARAQGVPHIVILPVKNETRFPISKEIFTTRIRALLNRQSAGRVRFLAREQMPALERERELKRAGELMASSDPAAQEFRGADFFLTGTLQGQTTRSAQGVSDYVLYSFQLIDARTSEIVWEDLAEIKREGLDDAAYR